VGRCGSPPDGRPGAVELRGGNVRRVVELRSVSVCLPGEGSAAEQPPPRLSAMEPRGPPGDGDDMHAE
jgi:hypothetical protein